MKRSNETLKGEGLFHDDLLLYINRVTENFTAPVHDHDFIEFAYIAEGNGFHHINNDVHEVRKGQIFFIPIGIPHVFRPVSTDSNKHSLIVYNCIFPPQLLLKLSGFTSDHKIKLLISAIHEGNMTYFYLTDPSDTIEKLFLTLHREYALPREGSTEFLNTLLLQLLILIHRLKQQPESNSTRQLTQFDHLLTYMEQNLSQELSLKHLSAISRWSERHLQRLFARYTEQSFVSFLQSLRVQKSCELLRNTPFKISAIAEMVGYKDISSFLAVFKRVAGMTPSEFRKSST
ncbi:AraC family transcriptional regulator [Cohnella sp. WQ 127256]|uniref:AraC family transcriptional regulator n=1 Tax=Cohnella sp. WQ 127256 TaxID=2938790 RepID=UPI002119A3FD|nr:AraC family transcriptional regulator [Cohnella sp. WQ 127256]